MPRWSRPPAAQTNWFAIATAIAAIVVFFCGGGLSVGGPVGGQAGPLALTLSAPPTCDTQPVVEAFAGEYDENGKQVVRPFGWFNPGDVQVTWVAEGGTPPYRLTIDSQSRDIRTWEPFGAQNGAGTVSCARTRGQAFIVGDVAMSDDGPVAHTYFHEQPDADSGRKTIRATVTDSSGATADTTVNVYVILSVPGRGTPMEAGKTYRVEGTLLTVPDGIRLEMRGAFSGIGGASGFALHVLDLPDGNDAWLNVTLSLAELSRHIPPHSEDDSPNYDVDLHAKFDELLESIGRMPVVGRP